ncbi:hypothetical protein C2845_PM01G28010 [Panicum miliaceum]|uniref:RRM domain-containing protein n=1 Tax=Panicum miliaceum TaxID=4540 RepID=A0A3L6TI24_PANMI|nr:hypothetical protein C2845_PM01G28010 [Panicum miliaceum]
MRNYFDQFGDILEAVVITDKNTGRSKGYGFVTFWDLDAAMRACVDPVPAIDGRRANCNLASLGVQRSKPPTPQHGNELYIIGGSNKSMLLITAKPASMADAQDFFKPLTDVIAKCNCNDRRKEA